MSPWKVDGEPQTIRRALAPDERAKLEVRVRALRDGLAPFAEPERRKVESLVAAMFGGFRAMRQDGDDAVAIVEVTCHVLREFPLWAISEAMIEIAQGKAGLDRRFAPNDAQIFAVVERAVRAFRKTLEIAEAILVAPVEPPTTARDQSHIDKQVSDAMGALPPVEPRPEQMRVEHDGRHAERVAADLAARKARRELLQERTP